MVQYCSMYSNSESRIDHNNACGKHGSLYGVVTILCKYCVNAASGSGQELRVNSVMPLPWS